MGISRGFSAVNIRKFVLRAASLGGLVELGSLTPQAAAFLEALVRAGHNTVVAGGGTQAGNPAILLKTSVVENVRIRPARAGRQTQLPGRGFGGSPPPSVTTPMTLARPNPDRVNVFGDNL